MHSKRIYVYDGPDKLVSFKERVAKHNKKVDHAFEKAKTGQQISLTELMTSKEKLLA